ncbi:putative RNA-directed DNA polymerase [Helianthus debilis subsp. tardiflorus]
MQGVWGEIERRDPNPMTCSIDIATYNKIRSEQKLFQFLNAFDRQYDAIKREILRWDPLPSAEGAYAAVRKEMAHQGILGRSINTLPSQNGVAAGLTANGSHESEGRVFLSKGHSGQKSSNDNSSLGVDKMKLKCDHCGMVKHTKEKCFKLVGYPDWWNDGHKRAIKKVEKLPPPSATQRLRTTAETTVITENAAEVLVAWQRRSRIKGVLIGGEHLRTRGVSMLASFGATVKEEGGAPIQEDHNMSIQEEYDLPIQEETTERYVLPPRVNIGVPPKRYSPEKQSGSSRYPMANIAKGNLSEEAKAFTSSLYDEQIPNSVQQALELKNWKDAMETEMEALMKNDTWERCVLPPGKKPVGCHWVFTIKHKPDGTIERYKTRLVAKGYTKTYGID